MNLGERHAKVLTTRDGTMPLLMSFQVVQVHKPLLAVSSLVKAGHDVIFKATDPHVILSSGEKISINCNGGTYEIEVWIENPPGPGYKPEASGFARQTGPR